MLVARKERVGASASESSVLELVKPERNGPRSAWELKVRPHFEDLNDYLTIDEVAAYLPVPQSTISQVCREGRLPAMKIGKRWIVDKQDVRRWMEKQKQGASKE